MYLVLTGTKKYSACGQLLFAVVASLLFMLPGNAEESGPVVPVVIDSLDSHVTLTSSLQWYVADEAGLTVDEVALRYGAGAFTPSDVEWLELGMMDAVVWVALEIENQSDEERLFLQFRNPRMSHIDLYYRGPDGQYEVDKNGTAWPFTERSIRHPMPTFPISIAKGERELFFFRLENIGDFRIRVWLWGGNRFVSHISEAYHTELITIGGLLVLAIFHFLVFLSLRQIAYLYLSLFIGAWLLFFMAGNGMGGALIWGNWTWLTLRVHSLVVCLMLITFLLFTLSFLEARKTTPWLYRLGLGFTVLCAIHFVICCLNDDLIRVVISRFLTLGVLALIILLVVVGIYRGNRKAVFFFLSWIFLLIGSALILMLTWYVVSATWVMSTPLINLLFAMSIILWSFEITGRVKVRAQEQRLQLEEEVRRRTSELEQALGEVKTLSGLLPICSHCKKIRDDKGYWNNVEQYIGSHTDAAFTHGICPECICTHFPKYAPRIEEKDSDEGHTAAP